MRTDPAAPIFNRLHELGCLEDYLSRRPAIITVIVGPHNAGKTKLLEHFMRNRGLAGSCFIDARETPILTPGQLADRLRRFGMPSIGQQLFPNARSPEGLGDALKSAARGLVDKVKIGGFMEITMNGQVISDIAEGLEPMGTSTTLTGVTTAYTALLELWEKAKAIGSVQASSPPVLVVDEANQLMKWGEEFQKDRETLLAFFVAITKAKGRSHVVLATSDYSFLTWLSTEIGQERFTIEVNGDFPPQEARRVLDLSLGEAGQPGVSHADWDEVYKVCGGNALALQLAAGSYACSGSWQSALRGLANQARHYMRKGYSPPSGAGYSAADYAMTVKGILESPYNAVDIDSLVAALGNEPVEAMLRANLLALRPYSDWAKDIDPASFGPKRQFTLVTAPSAMLLYWMREERGLLLKPLASPQAAVASGSAGRASRPDSPWSSPEVQEARQEIREVKQQMDDVDGDIRKVEKKIGKVEEDIEKAELQGDRERVAVLQTNQQLLLSNKQKLRSNQKQLGTRLLQLGEKELLLLRVYKGKAS